MRYLLDLVTRSNFPEKYLNCRNKTNLVLLFVSFMFLNLDTILAQTICPSRREAAREYNICEQEQEVVDKIICMGNLRNRLERNCDASYNRYDSNNRSDITRKLETYSSQQLQETYQKERKRVQQYIARLTND
jgi:hypothetical protein